MLCEIKGVKVIVVLGWLMQDWIILLLINILFCVSVLF